MRTLTLADVLELHSRLLATSGSALGVRDLGAVKSAVNPPNATISSEDTVV